MELSSVVHYMNESYAFKLAEHRYMIRLRTKRDDFKEVTLCYVEKYLRERKVKDHPSFRVRMRKAASTSLYDYYEAVFSDQMEWVFGTIPMIACRYYFLLDDGTRSLYYGNYKFSEKEPYESIEMFNLVIHQADRTFFTTPEWSKGAVIYQIFPERFAATNDRVSSNWYETPMGARTRTNGSIRGITEKVGYLKDLGVDAIYLNPIFRANSSHRYDTIDYMEIDPSLGTEADFRELVETCHREGIRVLLDLVFNHSSTQFFAFQDLLKNQENSVYKDWYFVKEFPVSVDFPPKYLGFSFGPYLPKLNTDNPECKQYFLNVTRHYLRDFKVDGYRLDVADEVSHHFWREFRRVAKKENPDCLIMGEVWYDSTPYLRGDEFDSIMNYTVYDGIRNFLIGKLTLDQFVDIVGRERGETPLNYYHNSNILVGSHDTDRIYHFLGHDREKYLIAMSLLLFLPGSPLIYYGDEIMMDGGQDPDCRRGMVFRSSKEREIIRNLIRIKHVPAIRKGEIAVNKATETTLRISRFDEQEKWTMIVDFKDGIGLEGLKGKRNFFDGSDFSGFLPPNRVLIYRE